MKIWPSYAAFCCATFTTLCVAQIDIYQSDAYSVEEMCAREAEQSTQMDYNETYTSCIDKNRNNPMYQSDRASIDGQSTNESSLDNNAWNDTHDESNADD